MIFPKDVHVNECTCDLEKIQQIKDLVAEEKRSFFIDKDSNKLFYVDSFGWRGSYPGECDDCYAALVEKMKGN